MCEIDQRGRGVRWSFLLLAALGLGQPAVAATLYRWVDEAGVTQFSQYPPPAREAERVETTPVAPPLPPAPKPAAPEAQAPAASPEPEPEAAPPGDPASAAPPAVRRQNCAAARSNLAGLESSARLRVTGPDGEVQWLTGEAREARLEQARENVRTWCE